ncbi:MAG: hypothetical protein HKN20_03270, partial [Gemmatimonadetes bacterium]|nr:hypothetical protein [Gemmatimonadota bacterium]
MLIGYEILGDSVAVRSIQNLRDLPSNRPSTAARLTARGWLEYPPGASEYVAVFMDSNGVPAGDAFGFPARQDVAFDRPVDADGRIGGTAGPLREDVRYKHWQVPPGAASVALFRVDILETSRFDSRQYDSFVESADRSKVRASRLLNVTLLPDVDRRRGRLPRPGQQLHGLFNFEWPKEWPGALIELP